MGKKIFDNVLRSMEARIPAVMIPVINEACDKNYQMQEQILRLDNSHTTSRKRRESDSYLMIGKQFGSIYYPDTKIFGRR